VKYGKGPLPRDECTIERLEKAHFALVGNSDDVRREMDLMIEAGNPEWFIQQGDQGYLPLDDNKRMLERFADDIMPRYHDAPANS